MPTVIKRLVSSLIALVLTVLLFVHVQPWMQDVVGLTHQNVRWAVAVIAFPLIWIGFFGLPSRSRMTHTWQVFFGRSAREQAAPDVMVDDHALSIRYTHTRLLWEEIVSVELIWSENPWGDPWSGPFCDTDWLVKSSHACLSIYDSPENRAQLLDALAKHLPNFAFNYRKFDEAHRDRHYDLKGGRILVWQRAIPTPLALSPTT
ncbi:MAG TPA: hypothetical protein PLW86_12100 [Rhodocyclaceae bacterium]|nr:hypothetical protein [Rhodocyclaceae bacterium]